MSNSKSSSLAVLPLLCLKSDCSQLPKLDCANSGYAKSSLLPPHINRCSLRREDFDILERSHYALRAEVNHYTTTSILRDFCRSNYRLRVLCFSACSTTFFSTNSPFLFLTLSIYLLATFSLSAFSPRSSNSSSVVGTQKGSSSNIS